MMIVIIIIIRIVIIAIIYTSVVRIKHLALDS
jgi:hypothetical protein